MAEKYDVLVIGAGPGGYTAALRAAQLEARVAVIEDRFIGGVCLNIGCIPSKALLRSAEVYETINNARDYGILVEVQAQVDWPAVQKRKQQVVDRLTRGVAGMLKTAGVTVFTGRGSFVDAHTVEVKGDQGAQRVEAEHAIIATGSRPVRLPLPGFDLPGVIDSTGALELDTLPKRLLVVGGGVIGCELATLFSSLGVEVTIVEMLDRLLPMMDEDMGEEITRALRRRKVKYYVSSRATSLEQEGDGLRVAVSTPKGDQTFAVDKVLISVGRRPNVEDIGLETVGVKVDRGIVVNERMETTVPGVYAIGDATGKWWLAHVSAKEGVVAAENACGHESRMDYRTVPSCVFTHPEAASVGLSETQAREQGYDVLVGRFPFQANGRALTYGEREGFVKVISESKYNQVLGVHIVGPHASDLILEGGLACSMEATLEEIEATIHAHPTFGEAIQEAALNALGRALNI